MRAEFFMNSSRILTGWKSNWIQLLFHHRSLVFLLNFLIKIPILNGFYLDMCHLQSCAKSIKEPSGGSRRSQSHMANTHWLPYRIHSEPQKIVSFVNSVVLWAFHPILVTWFLAVFGDEVTKILCLFFFYFFYRGRQIKIQSKENQTTKRTKKQKTKLPKFVMSWALIQDHVKILMNSFFPFATKNSVF